MNDFQYVAIREYRSLKGWFRNDLSIAFNRNFFRRQPQMEDKSLHR